MADVKKLTTLEYAEFLERVHLYRKDFPQLRLGQAMYNILNSYHPNLAVSVRGTELDPFYRDDRVEDFLEYIKE